MADTLDRLGKWPIPGKQAREQKRLFVIKPTETLDVIHGKENHILVSFAVSNDFIHFGSMTIPAGVLSDPEVHGGDEVFYVLQGSVSVLIPLADEAESVSKSRYEVKQEQRFLIPEGVPHRYLNTTVGQARTIFGIAPGL